MFIRRALAGLFVATLLGASACVVGSGVEPEESRGGESSRRCAAIMQAAGRCYASVDEEDGSCRTACNQGFAQDVVGMVLGSIPYPCVGAFLNGLISTSCIFDKASHTFSGELVGCIATQIGTLISTIEEGKEFAECAKSADLVAVAKALAAKQALLAVGQTLAIGVKWLVCNDTCTAVTTAARAGCEPEMCNRARCTCFSEAGCPTISKCGGESRITGSVACNTIDSYSGLATTDQGEVVSCVSHTNATDRKTCLGEASENPCGGDAGADSGAEAW